MCGYITSLQIKTAVFIRESFYIDFHVASLMCAGWGHDIPKPYFKLWCLFRPSFWKMKDYFDHSAGHAGPACATTGRRRAVGRDPVRKRELKEELRNGNSQAKVCSRRVVAAVAGRGAGALETEGDNDAAAG